jgi:hypothetical protein
VLGNHLHLIIEADDSAALTRGVQGLSIRIAKALNAMMEASGRVFDDHYHSRLLRSPTELVRAIRYVLGNHEHHFAQKGLDPYSSAVLGKREVVVSEPRGWLLRVGWKLAG